MTAREDVLRWLHEEQVTYAAKKWAEAEQRAAHEAHMAALRLEGPTTWDGWAGNYLRRAALFGIHTPMGRQALGKTIVTLIHFLTTAVELYGAMPAPGVPSGELREWEPA
ncbi:MAG TPA: hypothetical protein VF244_10955 [Acidimicrobiales bacterium]